LHSIIAVAVLVLAAQVSATRAKWRWLDEKYGEFLQASEAIPRGSRILPAKDKDYADHAFTAEYFWHVPLLAVIERDAYTPTFFAIHNVSENYGNLDVSMSGGEFACRDFLVASVDDRFSRQTERSIARDTGGHVYWAFWPRRYDVVYYAHEGRVENPVPSHLESIGKGSYFQLFRIKKPESLSD
jgi:hypothetical protein